jgi:transcriptional regulator
MLIHPWDAALDAAEWQDWLAASGRFGILAVGNLDPARAPLMAACPTAHPLGGHRHKNRRRPGTGPPPS